MSWTSEGVMEYRLMDRWFFWYLGDYNHMLWLNEKVIS